MEEARTLYLELLQQSSSWLGLGCRRSFRHLRRTRRRGIGCRRRPFQQGYLRRISCRTQKALEGKIQRHLVQPTRSKMSIENLRSFFQVAHLSSGPFPGVLDKLADALVSVVLSDASLALLVRFALGVKGVLRSAHTHLGHWSVS